MNDNRLRTDFEVSGAETRRLDPRDPDHSRSGIFIDHNCYRCKDGKKPCVRSALNQCDYPRARND